MGRFSVKTKGILPKSEIPFCVVKIDKSKFILNMMSSSMPVVDSLGEEFLNYVKDGMMITVKEGGVVEVDG